MAIRLKLIFSRLFLKLIFSRLFPCRGRKHSSRPIKTEKFSTKKFTKSREKFNQVSRWLYDVIVHITSSHKKFEKFLRRTERAKCQKWWAVLLKSNENVLSHNNFLLFTCHEAFLVEKKTFYENNFLFFCHEAFLVVGKKKLCSKKTLALLFRRY